MNRYRGEYVLVVLFILWSLALQPGVPQDPPDTGGQDGDTPARDYTADVAVRVQPFVDAAQLAAQHGGYVRHALPTLPGWYVMRFATVDAAAAATAAMQADPAVMQATHQWRTACGPRTNDQYYNLCWWIKNTGQEGIAGTDINVEPVWAGGITGAGVDLAISDSAVQIDHPDLAGNYDSTYSYDYDNDDGDPSPVAATDNHGTVAAGLAAAVGDNNEGIVGVARGCNLAGIKGTDFTDASMALWLSHENANIEVYNCSWGPPVPYIDMGGTLVFQAIRSGATAGRGGKGCVYVFAGGNDGPNDEANYDPFVNMPEVICVGSTDENDQHPSWSEQGDCVFLCAPGGAANIISCDRTGAAGYNDGSGFDGDYYRDISGTSLSAPMISGVVALLLEANDTLTRRDVQHILTRACVRNDTAQADWTRNAAGRWFNRNYGFGRIDAQAAVTLAQGWTNVAAEATAGPYTDNAGVAIPNNNASGVTRTINVPDTIFCEHVLVEINSTLTNWTQFRIELTSPSGRKSTLATPTTSIGTPTPTGGKWVFSSLRQWGESGKGTWTLKIADTRAGSAGNLTSWKITILGTSTVSGSDAVITGVAPAPANRLQDVTISGENFANASLTLGGVAQTVISQDSTSVTFNVKSSTPTGAQPLILTTDNGTCEYSLTVNAAAATSITSCTPDPVVRGTTLTITGVSFENSTVTIGGITQTLDSESPTQITLTVAANTPTGSQAVVVTNANGNDNDSVTVLHEPTAISGAAPDPVRRAQELVISGANFSNCTVSIGAVAQSITSQNATEIRLDVDTSTPLGSQVVSVTGDYGNDTTSVTVNAELTTISGVAPDPVVRGTALTIDGSGFANCTVTIGGIAQTLDSQTPTQLTLTVAAGTPLGSQVVSVSGDNGNDTANVVVQHEPLVVTGATPDPVMHLEELVITGQQFANCTVTIGGIAQTISSQDATSIHLNVALNTPTGSQTVQVIGDWGSDSTTVTVTVIPLSISGVSPDPVVRGAVLTITGVSFGGCTVTIGGLAQTLDSETSTQITLTVDAATPLGSQTVSVTGTNGSDSTTVTVDPLATVVSGVAPDPVDLGEELVISGSNFANTMVTIGGIVQVVTLDTPTEVRVTVAATTPLGTQVVSVTGDNGTDTANVVVNDPASGGGGGGKTGGCAAGAADGSLGLNWLALLLLLPLCLIRRQR